MVAAVPAVVRKLIRNAIFNTIGRFWMLGVGFLLTPYIVSRLGTERFGVWALVLTVLAGAGFIDLGIGAALVPHIAEAVARDDRIALGEWLGTALAANLMLTLLAALGLLAGTGWLLATVAIPADLLAEARVTLQLAVLLFAVANIAALTQSVLVGLQRLGHLNGILWLVSLVQIGAIIWALSRGHGMIVLVWINVATNLLTFLGCTAVIRRSLPGPLLVAWRPDRLRSLLAYGLRVQFIQLAAVVTHQAGKVLLGATLLVSAVAAYELGYRVALTLVSLPLMLLPAIAPAVAELHEQADASAVRRLYEEGSRYLALATIPLGVFAIWAGPGLITAWLADEAGALLPQVILAARWLLFALFVNVVTGVATSIARGLKNPRLESQYAALTAVLTVVFGLWWVRLWGFVGPLAAFGIASLVATVFFLVFFHRQIALPLHPFLVHVYGPPLLAASVALAATVLSTHLLPLPTLDVGRLALIGALLPVALLFAAVYAIALLLLGALTTADLRYLRLLVSQR
ncbi:MAG: oligosaccharide flippase family protein [Ardenticatenaceae bacterium]|nr:oligosaccharide flippase family protein [Ardenticatenaceae bacterium]